MKFVPRAKNPDLNAARVSPLRELAVYLAGAAVFAGAVFFALGLVATAIVPLISPKLERQLLTLQAAPDPAALADVRAHYLQRLLDRIPKDDLPVAYDFRIVVVDDKRPNALAMPGGTIVVTAGLLQQMPSENALVFVLGHELGHFAGRDHLYNMGRGLLLTVGSTVIFGKPVVIGSTLVANSFGHEQEVAADRRGLKAQHDVYGHAGGASQVFDVFARADPGNPGTYLSTHPSTAARRVQLQAEMMRQHYSADKTLIPNPYMR